MSKGKICVSICADNADEFTKNIRRAKSSATVDVVELRFDCLNKSELETALEETCNLETESPLLLTFRPKEQGGMRDLTLAERERFWCSGYDFCTNWADVEIELIETVSHWLFETVICSHHDFDKVPENLNEIYEKLKQTPADILKIAVFARDICDTIPVWKLLEKAKLDNKKIIPIAMGEAGKWTRILGLAHGSFLTYAALEAGKETASGQVTVEEFAEVYRARELNEATEIYGILGSNTSVSMSPYIHNAAFKFHNLNAVFVPLQVNDLDQFVRRMVKAETREIELNFKGFSVTIPHKQAILNHLDFLDETAGKIGAVNTVKITDGKLYGFNTDAQGFIEPLLDVYGNLKDAKVAVLGAGGAARACVYALMKEAANVTIFARDVEKARDLMNDFQVELQELIDADFDDFDILVNATPLGMREKAEGETPVRAEQLKNLKLVYDLIYVPSQTALMDEADKANVPKIGGMAMLIAQAAEQQKIWTGKDAPIDEMRRAALRRLQL